MFTNVMKEKRKKIKEKQGTQGLEFHTSEFITVELIVTDNASTFLEKIT